MDKPALSQVKPDTDAPLYLSPGPMGELINQRYGLNCGPRRLQKLRLRGGGPPYSRDGHDVVYHVEGTLAWVERRLVASLVTWTAEEAARGEVRSSPDPLDVVQPSRRKMSTGKTGPPASTT